MMNKHPQNLLSSVNLSDRHWTIYQLFQVLGLEDLHGLDKMQKNNVPRCLLLAMISLPLNYPRRQCITPYIQQTVTYTRLYTSSSVSYWHCRCHRQQARDLSVQLDAWNPTYGQLLAMNDCPTYHLCSLSSTRAHLIFQRPISSTKSTFLGKSVW
jgi:hypothetical protein